MASSSFISLVSIFFFILILSFNYSTFSLRVDSSSSSSSSSSNLEREGEGRQTKRRVTAETSEVWCVAKNNAEDTALQSGLDWVCGLGGADCGAIQQSGACYEPNNIQALASYAFNDYFHKNILDPQACVFGNTAALTALNPSHGKCVFPSSFLARNGSFTGSATGANGMGSSAGDFSGSYNAFSREPSFQTPDIIRYQWTTLSRKPGLALVCPPSGLCPLTSNNIQHMDYAWVLDTGRRYGRIFTCRNPPRKVMGSGSQQCRV